MFEKLFGFNPDCSTWRKFPQQRKSPEAQSIRRAQCWAIDSETHSSQRFTVSFHSVTSWNKLLMRESVRHWETTEDHQPNFPQTTFPAIKAGQLLPAATSDGLQSTSLTHLKDFSFNDAETLPSGLRSRSIRRTRPGCCAAVKPLCSVFRCHRGASVSPQSSGYIFRHTRRCENTRRGGGRRGGGSMAALPDWLKRWRRFAPWLVSWFHFSDHLL